MAKALPYFKFYCSEWSDGDITLEDMKTQGVFINICSYYWSQECDISFEKLLKRFKNYKKQIENLKKAKIIFSKNENLVIKFLDKQWTEREAVKHRNQQNGKAGGRPKKTQSVSSGLAKTNPNETNIEEKREEEKREDIKDSLSEQSSDVPEWLKKADPFYLNICEWFYNSLIQLDIVKKNTKWESKSWYDGFKRLLTIDGVDYETQFRPVINFYLMNYGKDFCPIAESPASVRTKWKKLEAYYKNNNKKPMGSARP